MKINGLGSCAGSGEPSAVGSIVDVVASAHRHMYRKTELKALLCLSSTVCPTGLSFLFYFILFYF